MRPARLERATSWFVAGTRESTGGSGRPLPQYFRWSVDRQKLPETASSRRRLSAICQSCDPLVMGIRSACFWARRSLVFEANCQSLSVVLSSLEGSSADARAPSLSPRELLGRVGSTS